ncbi:MAG: tetratricopeptide repeat protein [Maricaulaceae bacterium]
MTPTWKFLRALLACTVLAGGVASVLAPSAWAQEEEEVDRSFSAAIGEIVLKAQELLEAEDWAAALVELDNALSRQPSPYEASVIYNLRGRAHFDGDDIPAAISDFQRSIATGALLPNEARDLRLTLGQFLIAEERYDEGIELMERALREGAQDNDRLRLLLATAYAQADRYREALPHARRAFELALPKERKHYDFLNYLFSQLDMPKERAELLEEMLDLYPKDRQIWTSIAALKAVAGLEREAFEVNKLMYLNGMVQDERDIIRLIDYYSFFEVPYQGAVIMEREMNSGRIERNFKHLEKLANLWRQAREYDKAIPVLEAAAQAASDGSVYEKLGEAYYSEGEYADAEDALRKAIDRGVSDPGNLWVLIGNTRYERDDRQGAINAFQQGTQYGPSRRTARGWIQFINGEIEAEQARVEFERNVLKEECEITIERAQRDLVISGATDIRSQIREECYEFLPSTT